MLKTNENLEWVVDRVLYSTLAMPVCVPLALGILMGWSVALTFLKGMVFTLVLLAAGFLLIMLAGYAWGLTLKN